MSEADLRAAVRRGDYEAALRAIVGAAQEGQDGICCLSRKLATMLADACARQDRRAVVAAGAIEWAAATARDNLNACTPALFASLALLAAAVAG